MTWELLTDSFLFSGKLWATSLQSPEAKKNQGELKELLAENKNLSSSTAAHHARQCSEYLSTVRVSFITCWIWSSYFSCHLLCYPLVFPKATFFLKSRFVSVPWDVFYLSWMFMKTDTLESSLNIVSSVRWNSTDHPVRITWPEQKWTILITLELKEGRAVQPFRTSLPVRR